MVTGEGMPGLESTSLIVIGLIMAITVPFLSNVHLMLPPPRTTFGRRAGIIADEALACVLILGGIGGLLGPTPFAGMLHDLQAIIMVIFVMVFLGGFLLDRVISKEENEKRASVEKPDDDAT